MANENMIKFLRGNAANLPQTATAGALYFTKDEGIYMGMEDGSYHRYGDFIMVNDVDSLPASGAHATCMYYCTEQNILCRYDSANSKWIQINKQPTAEEMKTLLGLGSLAYKSVVAESDLSTELAEKVNAASEGNHAHLNKGVLDGITADKVSAWDAVEGNAKTYADTEIAKDRERLVALEAIDHEHSNKALLDTYTQTETDLADAVAKKHSHANADELAKFVDGDKAKYDAVVADHLTSADKTTLENAIKEAKKAGTDANTALEAYKVTNDAAIDAIEEDIAEIVDGTNGILAQAKSYSDGKLATARTEISAEIDADVKVVADDLAGYKTSNDAALAGVKATAEAAATKTYTDEELAKKVAKTDYEADKATFATKTELGNVDVKFASYRTSADQDVIDNGHKERIEALEAKFTGDNSVDAKIAAAVKVEEDARKEAVKGVQDAVDGVAGRMTTAEGKISALETESAKHALKTELEAVDKKFEDYTKTADLPTDLGDFSNEAGYAKTADVNTELDKKADKTQVATDIANAISPLATTEALNGVKATAEAAAVKTEVEAALALKADKSVVDAMYTNAQIDGFIAGAKSYADGLIEDANLDQYTTEQEVKDIVDGVIAGAVDGDTITGLANLVEYLNTHGAEAKEMGAAIDVLEGKVETIEGKPAYGITATQISNWDGEVGAKALAETKLDASVFTEYSNAHAGDYTNKQIDDAIDADVKTAIDAEVARANGAYDAKGDAGKAQAAAEAKAAELDGALKAELQAEIDADVKALADTVYTKSQVYTQTEVDALINAAHTWGEF